MCSQVDDSNSLAALATRLGRSASAGFQRPFLPSSHLAAGMETQLDSAEYYWDGERRGGDARRPYVVVQYTLSGAGAFEDGVKETYPHPLTKGKGEDTSPQPSPWKGEGVRRLRPGDAFFAVVPSRHKYYLPRTSTSWQFIWVIIRQPYAVSRIAESVEMAGAVHHLPFDGGTLAPRFVRLYEAIQSGQFRDEYDQEAAAVDFAIEFARHARDTVYPQGRRERLLDQTRAIVIAGMQGELSVGNLAVDFGMTRTGFSHHFKSITGIAPAAFIRQVRLEQAALILTHGDAKLEAVASACGFPSANDLCKLFRKHYHQSPTVFRRLTNRS